VNDPNIMRRQVTSFSMIAALRIPILASLLKNRAICLAVSGAAILQLSLVALGLPGWRSPILFFSGVPDPGGGLTRAILALLEGDWQTSLTFHAFASFFVVALVLIAMAAILPSPLKDRIIAWVEEVEGRMGLTAILLVGLVIYWLARLFILREAYISLMAG
jgi:hypothetical protein